MTSYRIGRYFEDFIQKQVTTGRFNNASEIIREGLRLVEEREKKLDGLKRHLAQAIEKGGRHSPEEIVQRIRATHSS